MKELDRARIRVEEQNQVAELVKPLLIQQEKKSLESVSPRVFTILREVKSFIEEKENIPMKFRAYFEFGSSRSDEDRVDIAHFRSIPFDENDKGRWWKMRRINGETRYDASMGPGGTNTPYFLESLNRPIVLLTDGDKNKMQEWVNENAKLSRIVLYIDSTTKKGEIPDISVKLALSSFGKDYGPYISYDEKIGKSLRKKLGIEDKEIRTDFDVGNSHDSTIYIDRFAESVYFFLSERNYYDINTEKQEKIKTSPNTSEVDQIPVLASDKGPGDSSQVRDDATEMQWRAAHEAEEKERILLEIERRMKEDSTYKAPGRIPEDTLINFLNRGEFGRMQTERDQFLNDDDFQAAMYRHFPSGPN